MEPPIPARHCLVTGAAGFIGSHLVDHLLAEGHRVTAIDNLANGRLDNLMPLSREGLTFHQLDAADVDAISPLFSGVDWVFHLAALADIVPSIEQPLRYVQANVSATAAVLDASRRAGVKRFLYTASSSCYGLPDTFPTPEHAPCKPAYPYALTKMLGEEMALHFGQVYGLPVVSLRLFNVYGPRHRTSGTYGAVFGVFLAQKLAGKPFTVVGDGEQKRDFTYVSDVVSAFIAAAHSDVQNEIFNVGSGDCYSVNQLCDLLGGPRVHIPKRPGEPDMTFADIRKIQRSLNWRPRVTFADGVKKLMAHIDQWRTAPVWEPQSIERATADWFKYLKPKPKQPA